jgi:hypothetical protein
LSFCLIIFSSFWKSFTQELISSSSTSSFLSFN